MMDTAVFFRRFRKYGRLRAVNLLALILACSSAVIIYSFLAGELRHDRTIPEYKKKYRIHVSYNNEKADGRIWYYPKEYRQILEGIPEIEEIQSISVIKSANITAEDRKFGVNFMYLVRGGFIDFFGLDIRESLTDDPLSTENSAIISERLALQQFGTKDVLGKSVDIGGRSLSRENVVITGVFADMPENLHLKSDFIVFDEYNFWNAYNYISVADGTDIGSLEELLSRRFSEISEYEYLRNASVELMPVSDIYLKSRVHRELKPGGNIAFVYVAAGALFMLVLIVLINLWLNGNIIFLNSQRYFRLLGINGASTGNIIRQELAMSGLVGVIAAGISITVYIFFIQRFPHWWVHWYEWGSIVAGILLLYMIVSALAYRKLSVDSFTTGSDVNGSLIAGIGRISFKGLKWFLLLQYVMVSVTILSSLIIRGQIREISRHELGDPSSILLFEELPPQAIKEADLLKEELEKTPYIEYFSGAMQNPGDAIRDLSSFTLHGMDVKIQLPILVVGEDFENVYDLELIAGRWSRPPLLTFAEEFELFMTDQSNPTGTDEYVITRSVATALGFESPDQAIGLRIDIEEGSPLYMIPNAVITGVAEDFVYTTVYESKLPLVLIRRSMFMNNFLIKIDGEHQREALSDLVNIWNRILPDYPCEYIFLDDHYGRLYFNERKTSDIISLFTILTLAVILLGLVVIMAFTVRIRTREIAIRKVCGADSLGIIGLLTGNLLLWATVGFVIAVPAALILSRQWIRNFALQYDIPIWIYPTAYLLLIAVSLGVVIIQAAMAARINPASAIKKE